MSRKNQPLTFQLTRGTKTYYLPTGKGVAPIITLMLRHRHDEMTGSYLYSAGMTICSAGDRFIRKLGRATAFERLRWARFRGLEFANPLDLLAPLAEQVEAAIKASPIHLTILDTQDEILGILNKAKEAFDKMDEHRALMSTIADGALADYQAFEREALEEAAGTQGCCSYGTCDS